MSVRSLCSTTLPTFVLQVVATVHALLDTADTRCNLRRQRLYLSPVVPADHIQDTVVYCCSLSSWLRLRFGGRVPRAAHTLSAVDCLSRDWNTNDIHSQCVAAFVVSGTGSSAGVLNSCVVQSAMRVCVDDQRMCLSSGTTTTIKPATGRGAVSAAGLV